jgi:hypothetical protein
VTKYTSPRFEVGLLLDNLKGGIMSELLGSLGSFINNIGGLSGIGGLVSNILGSLL